MKPTIGRIVHYRLNQDDANLLGGNSRKGDIVPAIVVRVWSDECVNLKVFGDGPTDAWKTSSTLLNETRKNETEDPGWFWPARD